jgi:hypothetical protein
MPTTAGEVRLMMGASEGSGASPILAGSCATAAPQASNRLAVNAVASVAACVTAWRAGRCFMVVVTSILDGMLGVMSKQN